MLVVVFTFSSIFKLHIHVCIHLCVYMFVQVSVGSRGLRSDGAEITGGCDWPNRGARL